MTSRRHLLRAGFAATLLQACGARAADDAAPLRFSDFYVGPTFEDGVGMRPELQLSPRVLALSGRRVEIVGFMDGILPRDGMYFMLIREPSFLCPFHTVSFDWAGFVPVFVETVVASSVSFDTSTSPSSKLYASSGSVRTSVVVSAPLEIRPREPEPESPPSR